jgi:hypothetical protein
MVGVNKRIAALKFQGQGVLPTVKIFCCEQKIFSFFCVLVVRMIRTVLLLPLLNEVLEYQTTTTKH